MAQNWTAPATESGPYAAPNVPPPAQNWTYWDVVVVTVFALGAQALVYVGGILALLLLQQVRGSKFLFMEVITHAYFVLPVQLVWWALVFWIVYRVVRARDPRPFRQAIGWVRPGRPVGAYLGGGALLALSVAGFAWLLPMSRHKMPMEFLFQDPASAFLMAAFGVLIAPAIEELLFRGFLFPVVERRHGVLAAVLGTAALFSVLHGQQYGWAWQNLLLLLYVGVVFGVIRAVSRSLIPSTLVHAAYNLTLFVALYASSDRFRNFKF